MVILTKHEMSDLGLGKVVLGDCLEVMKELPDKFFVLGFTSPPYFNAVNYSEHVQKLIDKETDQWKRQDIEYEFYLEFLKWRFRELYRIISRGGHCIVNIAPVAWEGKRYPLPFHFVSLMEDVGWEFKEDIIWEKEIARDRRSGVLLQHPYPGYYYPSLVAEYVLVFQKKSWVARENNIYWSRTEVEKYENQIDLSSYQGEMSKNVWKIRPVAPGENEHPCPFPVELAKRVIEFYSYRNDWVIDIFAGSGTTNVAAEDLHRKHLGIEQEDQYVELVKETFSRRVCMPLFRKV